MKIAGRGCGRAVKLTPCANHPLTAVARFEKLDDHGARNGTVIVADAHRTEQHAVARILSHEAQDSFPQQQQRQIVLLIIRRYEGAAESMPGPRFARNARSNLNNVLVYRPRGPYFLTISSARPMR